MSAEKHSAEDKPALAFGFFDWLQRTQTNLGQTNDGKIYSSVAFDPSRTQPKFV